MKPPKKYVVEYKKEEEIKTRVIMADSITRVLNLFYIFENKQPRQILSIYEEL